jgi:hypothetical protein
MIIGHDEEDVGPLVVSERSCCKAGHEEHSLESKSEKGCFNFHGMGSSSGQMRSRKSEISKANARSALLAGDLDEQTNMCRLLLVDQQQRLRLQR